MKKKNKQFAGKRKERSSFSLFYLIKSKWKIMLINFLCADYIIRAKRLSPLIYYPFAIFIELDAKEFAKTHTIKEFIEYVNNYPEKIKQEQREKKFKSETWKVMDDILEKGGYQPKDSEDNFEAYSLLLDSGFTHQEIVEYYTENIHFYIS